MGKIDTSEWGMFHLYDLFEISMGNKFDKTKMTYKQNGINFIGRSYMNNGVATSVDYVLDKKTNVEVKPYKAGDITIAMGGSIGSAFIQEKDFYTSQNVCVLHTNNQSVTFHAKLFVIASIQASCANYEAFVDELNRHIKTDFIIYLPIDNDGNPNWKYMSEYMRDIEARTCDKISRLERVIRYRGCAIDVSNWKGFKVGELFDIYLSKDDIQPKNIVDGKTPLVSSGKDNNGIMAYIENDSAKLWNSNTLTVDMFGKVFYQPNSYYCVSHGRVNILVPKNNMEKYELMFIATVIERITLSKYNFTQMCTSKKLKNDIIYLPTKNGSLDCNYMEVFMKNIEKQVKEKLMIV